MQTAEALPEYNPTDDLFYIGVTHRSAPLAVREHLHASPEKQRAMLARLAQFAPGRMVLATCERLEVYASTTHATNAEWIAAVADWFHVQPEVLARYAVIRRGGDVIDHWFRVSAGLDSRILGEPHVLGQMRTAYAQAADAGSLDSALYALGRAAIRVGKRVRAETSINKARRSIATLAVEHVCKTVKNLSGASVVVTGTGHLASDVVDELTRRSAGNILIAGRTKERAQAIALKSLSLDPSESWASARTASINSEERACSSPTSVQFGLQHSPLAKGGLRGVLRSPKNLPRPLLVKEGGKAPDCSFRVITKCRGAALDLADLPMALAAADALISCTAAPSHVVDPAAIGTHRRRVLRIVDLSVPRNVDPDVDRLPRVTLTTLEDLLAGEAAHHTGIADAERIIDEERTRFEQWCHRRSGRVGIAARADLARTFLAGGAHPTDLLRGVRPAAGCGWIENAPVERETCA